MQVAAEVLRLLLDELLPDGQEEWVGGFDLKAAAVGRRDVRGGVGAAVARVRAAGAAAALRTRDGGRELDTLVTSRWMMFECWRRRL